MVALAVVVGCGRLRPGALGPELVADREIGRSPVEGLAQTRRVGRPVTHVLERAAQVRHVRVLVDELREPPPALDQRDERCDERRTRIALATQRVVLEAGLNARPERGGEGVTRTSDEAVRAQVEVLEPEVQRLVEVVLEACLPALGVEEIVSSARAGGDRTVCRVRTVRRVGGAARQQLSPRKEADVRVVLESGGGIHRPALAPGRPEVLRQLVSGAGCRWYDQGRGGEHHHACETRAHRGGASCWPAAGPAPPLPREVGAPRRGPGTSSARARRARSSRRNPVSRCTAPVRSAWRTLPTRRRNAVRSAGARTPPAPSAARAPATLPLIACALAGSRMLPAGALRIVSSSVSSNAPSASSPGSGWYWQPASGAQRAASSGSTSAQVGAAAGQSFAPEPVKAPNATGTEPTTSKPAAAPEGSRKDSTPELPLAIKTRPWESIAMPSGPDSVGSSSNTEFWAVSIAITLSFAGSLTQARARSASTAIPNGLRPTRSLVRTVRLTRPMTVTEPPPKFVT